MHLDQRPAYLLPRRYLYRGKTCTLQQALHRGADPADLQVEDGPGVFRPYLTPRELAPAQRPLSTRAVS